MSTHIMWDLETLGTSSNAAILSIGAVKFDPDVAFDPKTAPKFDVQIDLEDAMKYGRVEAGAILFWLGQKKAAQNAFLKATRVNLDEALLGFADWYGDDDSVPVWGNGATFDNVILSNAYKAVGIDRPWNYGADRCFRTLKNVKPAVEAPEYGVKHNALDDAIFQTLWLLKIVDRRNIQL